MKDRRLSTLIIACGLASANTHAQTAPPPACEAPEYRQFDFWLGAWEVTGGPKLDTIVGRNTIRKVATGCALREHWVNAGGRDGHSLNVYDKSSKRWTQFWIGSDGVILRLSGSLRKDGAMEMRGNLLVSKGGAPKGGAPKGGAAKSGMQQQRIVWTLKPDGSVVQRWDTSDDGGKTWQISFVGIYRRVTEADALPSASK